MDNYKFKGKELFDRKRGQLVTLDWNAGKKGMQKSWFFLSQLRFSQAGSSINILMWKNISQSAITIGGFHLKRCQDSNVYLFTLFSLSFYFKSPIYFNFVSILSFAALLNKFFSVCNLHVLTEIRDSDLCTLLDKTSVNILSIQMKIKLQWLILIFKMVWWYQACICNNIVHCRDFYIPICWHGCLRHW